MLLEQIGGVDRLLVTPINERHALAVEFDEGNFGHSFGCRSNQRRHLGTCLRCLRGPTRGLTNIRVTDIGAAFAPFGDLGKERRFLRAGEDRKSTRLNSSHQIISYAVFCLKKKKITGSNLCLSISPVLSCQPLSTT